MRGGQVSAALPRLPHSGSDAALVTRMLQLFSVLIAAGLFLACLTAYVLDNYTVQQRSYGGAGGHPRGAQPPYPGGSMDNVFWFLQVARPPPPVPAARAPSARPPTVSVPPAVNRGLRVDCATLV